MGLPFTFSSTLASYAARHWFTSLLQTAYTVICLSCLHSGRLLHTLQYNTFTNYFTRFNTTNSRITSHASIQHIHKSLLFLSYRSSFHSTSHSLCIWNSVAKQTLQNLTYPVFNDVDFVKSDIYLPNFVGTFGFLAPEDGTDRLSRNVGNKLPPLAAWWRRRAQVHTVLLPASGQVKCKRQGWAAGFFETTVLIYKVVTPRTTAVLSPSLNLIPLKNFVIFMFGGKTRSTGIGIAIERNRETEFDYSVERSA